jgi:hypothetical protein
MSPAEKPASTRRPRLKIDEEAVVMQVARIALTLLSLTIIVENLTLDLGLNIGQTPAALGLPETMHVAPKAPKGATVHVEPTIQSWIEGRSGALSSKLEHVTEEQAEENETKPHGRPAPPPKNGAPAPLKKGQREILRVLAAVGMPLSKQRISTLTGLSAKSGTFSDYLSALRTRALIVEADGKIALTHKGQSEAGTSALDDAQVRAMWEGKLKKGMRQILATLAKWHPNSLTKMQLATLCKMSRSSGTFSDYLSKLRTNALIEESADGGVQLSEEGRIVAPPEAAGPPHTRNEILELWGTSLKAGARRMLQELVAVTPRDFSYEQLANAAKISPSSGTFSDYLSSLRSNGLVETTSDRRVRANTAIFGRPS